MNVPRLEFFKNIFIFLVLTSALFDLTNGGTSTTTSKPTTTKPTKEPKKELTKPPTKEPTNTTLISSRSSDIIQHEGSAERLKRQLYREQIPHNRPLSGNIYADHHGFPHPGRWYANAQQIMPANSNSGHHFESPNVILTDEDFNRYGSTLQHIDDHRIRHNPQPIVHEYPVQVSEVIPLGGGDRGHGVAEQPYQQYGPLPVEHGHGHTSLPVEHGHGHTVIHGHQTHYHHHIPAQPHRYHQSKGKPFLRLKFPFFGGHKGHRHQRPRFSPPYMKNLWTPGRYSGAGSEQFHHETAHGGGYSWEIGY